MKKKLLLFLVLSAGALLLGAVTVNGNKLFKFYVDFTLISAPSNPTSGNIRVFGNTSGGLLGCLTSAGASCLPTGGNPPHQITLIVGSGDITSTGTKACSTVEHGGTIVGVHLISNALPTGSDLVVDVLTVPFASYTGFASAMSITASDVPTITTIDANPRYSDTTLTGWTTAIATSDVVCVAINSAPAGGATYASLTLDIN